MHAASIVQRFFESRLGRIHAARRRLFADVVVLVMQGAWLCQSHLARRLSTSSSAKQAMKRIGRLIGSDRIGGEAQLIAGGLLSVLSGMTRHLVIAVDWSSAAPGGKFVELRASVTWPGAGRALPVYQQVHPLARLGDAKVEHALLDTLHAWIGPAQSVIVITDAGFRRPWFSHVERLGWYWIGRVRRGVKLYSPEIGWQCAGTWFERATSCAVRTRACRLSKSHGFACDIVMYRQAHRGRVQRGAQGLPSSHKAAIEARRSAREPWLLVHSPALSGDYRPDEIVAFYARRMQIEENFRDTKSPVFGMGFSTGRARTTDRLHGLLLLGVLAAFLLWHIGQIAETEGLHRRLRLTTRTERELSWLSLATWLCTLRHIPLSPPGRRALRARLHA
jgi:hypothetical protein